MLRSFLTLYGGSDRTRCTFPLVSHLGHLLEPLRDPESPHHKPGKRTSYRQGQLTWASSWHQEVVWKRQALYDPISLLLSHRVKVSQRTLLLSSFFSSIQKLLTSRVTVCDYCHYCHFPAPFARLSLPMVRVDKTPIRQTNRVLQVDQFSARRFGSLYARLTNDGIW